MKSLHESWLDVLAAAPDRIALQTPDGDVTCSRFENRSSRMSALLKDHAGCNALIAVPFSSHYYVALHACMRSKVTACPVDLSLPRVMLLAQVRRLSVSCVITHKGMHLPEWDLDVPVITMDDESDAHSPYEGSFPKMQGFDLSKDTPLHRLFTSGSSGEQSLVTIGQRSMAHDILHTPGMLGIGGGDVLCSLGSHVAAMQVYAFWRCLLNGISFMPIDPKHEGFSAACERLFSIQPRILRGHSTLIGEMLDSCRSRGALHNTSRLILGGEPLKNSRLRSFLEVLPSLDSITHNFSSTETLFVSAFTDNPERFLGMERIPVGNPQPGKEVSIHDEQGLPLPLGETGEIVVRSEHICSEIQGRDADRRLETDAFTGVKTYRTGDLGRIREDGMLEHLGRVDRQLKINGVRIDPFIVEQCIEAHESVRSCIVASVEHAGRTMLAAAYTSEGEMETECLRRYMNRSLPLSHHPSVFLRFDTIPTTDRGKPAYSEIVREMNERLAAEEATEGLVLSTPTEHRLAAIWTELLGMEVRNRDADFFMLGGYSLKAMRLSGMVWRDFKVFIPISELYKDGRLERMASYIDEKKGRANDDSLEKRDAYQTYCAWEGTGPQKVYSIFLGARNIVKAAELCHWGWSVIELMDPQVQRGETPDQPVEKLAPVYAEAILAEHREGPIVIMGNCVSGIDAYATACHLQHRTLEKIHVLLFDTRHRYGMEDGAHMLSGHKPLSEGFADRLSRGLSERIRRWAENGLNGSMKAGTAIRLLFREALTYRLFDPEWYLSRYPDVAQSGVDPLSHYVAMGWRELRDPSLVFSRSLYKSICPEFESGGQDPVLHYLLSGKFKKLVRKAVRELLVSTQDSDRIMASGWFDAEWYSREYPSVAYHGRSPLDHYMAIGWRFDRKPFPDYDPERFKRLFPGFEPGETNPLRLLLSMREIPRRTGPVNTEPKADESLPVRNSHDTRYIPAEDSELIKKRTAVRSRYRPEPFGGEVHIFSNQFLHARDPANGWSDGPNGRIRTVRLNGDHFTCLEDDLKSNAWKIDAVIRGIFNRANPPG